MKKILFTLLLLFVAISLHAQAVTGSWNATTATYTNPAHKITWKLIEGIDWVARPVLTGSTMLKAKNEDSGIMVTLGCQEFSEDSGDIWDLLPQYESSEFLDMAKAQAKQKGMVFKSVKAVRSQIAGHHATKVTTDMTKYHPEYDLTIHAISVMYQLSNGNHIYTLSVLATSLLEEEMNDFNRLLDILIRGFSIKD